MKKPASTKKQTNKKSKAVALKKTVKKKKATSTKRKASPQSTKVAKKAKKAKKKQKQQQQQQQQQQQPQVEHQLDAVVGAVDMDEKEQIALHDQVAASTGLLTHKRARQQFRQFGTDPVTKGACAATQQVAQQVLQKILALSCEELAKYNYSGKIGYLSHRLTYEHVEKGCSKFLAGQFSRSRQAIAKGIETR